jgi:glycosyltransferase involved in cell wall biosynthesis
MFVYNRCTADARVLKEARTLAEAGHRVRIVAVLDETAAAVEERDGFRIVRIDRNPIHYRLLRRLRSAVGIARRRLPFGFLFAPLAPLVVLLRQALLVPHKPLMFGDYYWRAYRLVRADPPDALHAHDLNTLPVAAALARRLRLPLTYDAHELYPEISTLSAREAAVWRGVERRLARRADHVLTVCDSIAAELERRYAIARPTVLLNCPATANGASADRQTGAPGEFVSHMTHKSPDGADGEPIVLYQGGFAPHRGLETLVRAAHRLERGTILLMGWGRLEEELRELIRRERLERRVRIAAPVAQGEVVAAAARATVGVIPYEPVGLNNTFTTPNKLFDYIAAGLPIVASRLPELTRFVEEGALGVTFPAGDPAALAATLNELLADPARLARMRERAREAAHRYTWERESRKLLALYDGQLTGAARQSVQP